MPSSTFAGDNNEYTSRFNNRPTVSAETLNPRRDNSPASFAVDFDVQFSNDIGSPRVSTWTS